MNFTAMGALIVFILCAADSLPAVFKKLGEAKGRISYFVLCVLALRRFEISFSTEFTLNISCIIILTVCAALEGLRDENKALKLLPVIALCAFPAAFLNLICGESEFSPLVFSFLTAAAGLMSGGPVSAFAVCAAAPVFAEITRFILEIVKYNYGTLEFTGKTCDAQLLGLIFAAVLSELHFSLKTLFAKRRNQIKSK